MPVDEDYVPSPCVRLCTLDEAGVVCVGCFRTLDEIKAWGTLDADGRRAVIAAADGRRAERQPPGARSWFRRRG